ncbi:MAG: GTP-binding protein [Gammaproteobacteria bacterium]|nr:GTP-binding protein [Gammaproteobacteria bacterium]
MAENQNLKEPIPVTIISGFLGAGKTSLLNHILNADHGLRVAVLVNDFGEINIDAELVSGVSGKSTINLTNGCICCSIRDDLLEATVQLIQGPNPPEYIVVETSGVSDPAAVSLTFLSPELQSRTRVDSVLTVVDAEQIHQANEKHHRLAVDQIAMADIVVLNKLDLINDEEREDLADFVRDTVPRARILEATFGEVPLDLVLGIGTYDLHRFAGKPGLDVHIHADGEAHEHDHSHGNHHEPHTDHTLVFNTWCYTTNKPLSRGAVLDAVKTLPATIYRAKGIVYLSDIPSRKGIVHVAGKRARLLTGEPWGDESPGTQLVFIGEEGGIDDCELQSRFDACQTEKDPHQDTASDADLDLLRQLAAK